MNILYDLEADLMINLRNFSIDAQRNTRGLTFPLYPPMDEYRVSFDVGERDSDYIREWMNSSMNFSSPRSPKRDIFITNEKHTIKLIGSFIRSISYIGYDSLRVELLCDVHHIQDTFPELKRIRRDRILTSLGID